MKCTIDGCVYRACMACACLVCRAKDLALCPRHWNVATDAARDREIALRHPPGEPTWQMIPQTDNTIFLAEDFKRRIHDESRSREESARRIALATELSAIVAWLEYASRRSHGAYDARAVVVGKRCAAIVDDLSGAPPDHRTTLERIGDAMRASGALGPVGIAVGPRVSGEYLANASSDNITVSSGDPLPTEDEALAALLVRIETDPLARKEVQRR